MAGLQHDPVAELDDQSGLFGDRDELGRRDRALGLVVPARQGFDRHHAPGIEFDDRLVMHIELIAPDRLTQIDFQRAALIGFRLHLGGIDMEAIAPRALRLVEGEVGIAQDFVDAFAVLRNEGDADAAAHDDRMAVDRVRGADRFDQARRQRFRALAQFRPCPAARAPRTRRRRGGRRDRRRGSWP